MNFQMVYFDSKFQIKDEPCFINTFWGHYSSDCKKTDLNVWLFGGLLFGKKGKSRVAGWHVIQCYQLILKASAGMPILLHDLISNYKFWNFESIFS